MQKSKWWLNKYTWLFGASQCILWGLALRSIILFSAAVLLTVFGPKETCRLCGLSLVLRLLASEVSIWTSRGLPLCDPGSSKMPGLSPGNYTDTTCINKCDSDVERYMQTPWNPHYLQENPQVFTFRNHVCLSYCSRFAFSWSIIIDEPLCRVNLIF